MHGILYRLPALLHASVQRVQIIFTQEGQAGDATRGANERYDGVLCAT